MSIVRRLEIVIALRIKLGVALLDGRRHLAVDVDHVEPLLDARGDVDRLDRLLDGRGESRSGQAKTCKSNDEFAHDHPLTPETAF